MFYEMRNGMEVEIDYYVDPHDRKCLEINSVKWRDVEIMSALMPFEMSELFSACYENEEQLAVCAAEDRADAARESDWGC
jgi:hypothetical protein